MTKCYFVIFFPKIIMSAQCYRFTFLVCVVLLRIESIKDIDMLALDEKQRDKQSDYECVDQISWKSSQYLLRHFHSKPETSISWWWESQGMIEVSWIRPLRTKNVCTKSQGNPHGKHDPHKRCLDVGKGILAHQSVSGSNSRQENWARICKDEIWSAR